MLRCSSNYKIGKEYQFLVEGQGIKSALVVSNANKILELNIGGEVKSYSWDELSPAKAHSGSKKLEAKIEQSTKVESKIIAVKSEPVKVVQWPKVEPIKGVEKPKIQPPKMFPKINKGTDWQREYYIHLNNLKLNLIEKGYKEAKYLDMPSDIRKFIMNLVPAKK